MPGEGASELYAPSAFHRRISPFSGSDNHIKSLSLLRVSYHACVKGIHLSVDGEGRDARILLSPDTASCDFFFVIHL